MRISLRQFYDIKRDYVIQKLPGEVWIQNYSLNLNGSIFPESIKPPPLL